jgi:hypothetical protein
MIKKIDLLAHLEIDRAQSLTIVSSEDAKALEDSITR